MDFPKKSNIFVQKQKCGISNDVFSCGTAEIQVTIYCAKLWNFKSQNILRAEVELRDLKSKLLYGSGTAKLQVVLNLWKRNCVTSKPQYFPCAEAELRHFRIPSHTLFCLQKRNCGTLSLSIFLVRRRNFKPKNIPCVEAEL